MDNGQRTAVRLREGCGQSLAPKIKLKQLISTKQPISSKVYLKCLNTQTGEPLEQGESEIERDRERRYPLGWAAKRLWLEVEKQKVT